VIPGRGKVDYRAYLGESAQLGREGRLMLEHLKTAEEYDEGRLYICRVGDRMGLTFA
jgi:sugar phosphate isomerase/epimerase